MGPLGCPGASRQASPSRYRHPSSWCPWTRQGWPATADCMRLGNYRLCLLISKRIIAYQMRILFQCAKYSRMACKSLCWKYPQTALSRNSQWADSLIIISNHPFSLSLTLLITDSFMIALLYFLLQQMQRSGLRLNLRFKDGTLRRKFSSCSVMIKLAGIQIITKAC